VFQRKIPTVKGVMPVDCLTHFQEKSTLIHKKLISESEEIP